MMKSTPAVCVVLASATLAACSPSAQDSPVSVHDEMVKVVIPQTQTIWDLSNATLDEEGNPVASRMQDADWTKLKTAATQVSASFSRLAAAKQIVATTAGQKIMDDEIPGAAKAADVDRLIKANPDGFRQYAKAMADNIATIGAAADKRDFATFNAKSGELDGACEGCHQAYWLAKPAP